MSIRRFFILKILLLQIKISLCVNAEEIKTQIRQEHNSVQHLC